MSARAESMVETFRTAARCCGATVRGIARHVGLVCAAHLVGAIACMLVLSMAGAAQTLGSNASGDAELQSGGDQEDARTYETLAREANWERIDALARGTLVHQPADVNALYWLGAARFQTGDTPGALHALRAAQVGGLASAQLHLELGQVYYKLNQFVLFQQQMEQAESLDPRDGSAQYLLGFYYLSVRSDVGRALALLRQASALRPGGAKVLYELGYCLELSGASAEAKEVYARAVAVGAASSHPFAWPYQGMARLALSDDPHRAVQFANEAVRLAPAEASNHLVLAKSYERVGETAKALDEAREAANRDPSSASTRYLLFRLYRRKGELTQADQELKAFHEIDAVYGPE